MKLHTLVLGLAAIAHIGAQGAQLPAPPGRMIDVSGRRLHLLCSGAGTPTVVLVAGGGAYAIDWELVQSRVASSSRVCSYDRAGLGWSDEGSADETVEQTVSDLHVLLRAAGEKPPYILSGASIGGIFIRAYQRTFPEEVVGLVFSNSSNRVGLAVNGKVGLLWELSEEEVRSAFPAPAGARPPKPTSEGEPFDRLPDPLQGARLSLDTLYWERSDPAKANGDSLVSWRREFLREFAENEAREHPLGSLPVFVVSSGPMAAESERKSREGAGAQLDFLSAANVHITADGSGHEIHLYQPDAVVTALSQAISVARAAGPR